MLRQVYLEQGSDEWLSWRRNGITATEVSCIHGTSKWGTALTVYHDKLNPAAPNESAVMEWGSRIEPVIRRKFADAHPDLKVSEGGCYEDGWMRCSLDGEVGDDAILEIKTTRSDDEWDPVPKGYYDQVQWQMLVTGRRKTYFAVLVNGYQYFEREVPFDEEYAKSLCEKAKAVWDCVCSKVPPEPSDTHPELDQPLLSAAAVEANPDDDGFEVPKGLASRWEKINAVHDAVQLELARLKAQITKLLAEHAKLYHNGKRFASMVKVSGRESFDSKRFKSEHPDEYAKYVKVGQPMSYPKIG